MMKLLVVKTERHHHTTGATQEPVSNKLLPAGGDVPTSLDAGCGHCYLCERHTDAVTLA